MYMDAGAHTSRRRLAQAYRAFEVISGACLYFSSQHPRRRIACYKLDMFDIASSPRIDD